MIRRYNFGLKSSSIGVVEFDDVEKKMKITYKKGKTFMYHPISGELYHGMLIAKSVGVFVKEKIMHNPKISCVEIK